jgi:hypothetical protein
LFTIHTFRLVKLYIKFRLLIPKQIHAELLIHFGFYIAVHFRAPTVRPSCLNRSCFTSPLLIPQTFGILSSPVGVGRPHSNLFSLCAGPVRSCKLVHSFKRIFKMPSCCTLQLRNRHDHHTITTMHPPPLPHMQHLMTIIKR